MKYDELQCRKGAPWIRRFVFNKVPAAVFLRCFEEQLIGLRRRTSHDSRYPMQFQRKAVTIDLVWSLYTRSPASPRPSAQGRRGDGTCRTGVPMGQYLANRA